MSCFCCGPGLQQVLPARGNTTALRQVPIFLKPFLVISRAVHSVTPPLQEMGLAWVGGGQRRLGKVLDTFGISALMFLPGGCSCWPMQGQHSQLSLSNSMWDTATFGKKLHRKQIPPGTLLIPACPVKGERIFRIQFIHCQLCFFT